MQPDTQLNPALITLTVGLGLAAATGQPASGLPGEDLTVLYWLGSGHSRHVVSVEGQGRCPDAGVLVLSVDGRELVLDITRNQRLLTHGYTETHYHLDGSRVTISPNHTDHCLYHGRVRSHRHSWLALSLRYGVRGVVAMDTTNGYYLQPIGENLHRVTRMGSLTVGHGRCGRGDDRWTDRDLMGRLVQHFHRVRRDSWDTEKFMEIYIVADHAEFQSQNRDLGKTKDRILEIANYVDKFYRSLNIRIALIGLEVWTHRDQIAVSTDPNAVLSAFLKWRRQLWARMQHDNAQLITGVTFRGTTIGMAPLEGMCSLDTSGGVSMDHSEPAIGAAATMAHEIGHNLGLAHDGVGCCKQASAEQGGCIMAAATGHPFPRVFSSCSHSDLRFYLRRGGGVCLYNRPDMERLYGARRCGNGYLEAEEECDCGEVQECANPCCNANNCTLTPGAQCAHGVCCRQCKLKSAGTVCRRAAGSCDLPEYCTGASAFCPSNVYRADGSSCENGHAYCYNGMCQSHQEQCQMLWGSGAQPAPPACFEAVNAAGNEYGNCGKHGDGTFVKCSSGDALCGKIQCLSPAENPRERNTVPIDTTILHHGRELRCRGTYLYSAQDGGDDADPGLVRTGTKCGHGRKRGFRTTCDALRSSGRGTRGNGLVAKSADGGGVCLQNRCRNASFPHLAACDEKCHHHGVCNSNGNCHCDPHWAPPFCDKPGLGGSIDSGPVHTDSYRLLVLGLLLTFLLVPALVMAALCYRKHQERLCAQIGIAPPFTHRGAGSPPPEHTTIPLRELRPSKAPSRPASCRLPAPSGSPAPSRPPPPSDSPAPSRLILPSGSAAPSRPPPLSGSPAPFRLIPPSGSPAPSRPPPASGSPAPSRLIPPSGSPAPSRPPPASGSPAPSRLIPPSGSPAPSRLIPPSGSPAPSRLIPPSGSPAPSRPPPPSRCRLLKPGLHQLQPVSVVGPRLAVDAEKRVTPSPGVSAQDPVSPYPALPTAAVTFSRSVLRTTPDVRHGKGNIRH
ncbi:disintegrin and metalloproteinase domain-containing protein 33-like [Mobula hypostoma]|uniref:disintegrin and metalloproteinase domain-containing protein 33-like n=1 Tax=Mobula hypostoma TaxID=723540 RepID=UPI002FC2CC3A